MTMLWVGQWLTSHQSSVMYSCCGWGDGSLVILSSPAPPPLQSHTPCHAPCHTHPVTPHVKHTLSRTMSHTPCHAPCRNPQHVRAQGQVSVDHDDKGPPP